MSTAVAEHTELEDLLSDDVPCECIRQGVICAEVAAARVLLMFVCLCRDLSVGATGWVNVCAAHRDMARNGTLKCGGCGNSSPRAYQLLREIPV